MKRRQQGFVVAALLLVLVFAGMAMMLGQRDLRAAGESQRHLVTMRNLAKARAALIGYAQIYHHLESGGTVGALPCPYMGLFNGEEGISHAPCSADGAFAIGRLPYQTLGLPPLRDGWGECLWYAVAGTFKNSKPAGPITWDTGGQFSITRINGEVLIPSVAPGRELAVAIVFSPGPPLASQQRGAPDRQCSGNPTANLARDEFLDGSYVPQTTVPSQIVAGRPGDTVNNDQIAWITAEDIFSERLIDSPDFKAFVDNMLSNLSTAIANTSPTPEASSNFAGGSALIGGVPAPTTPPTTWTTDEKTLKRYQTWRDQFRYALCNATTPTDPNYYCLRATTANAPCHAVLLFAGRSSATQNRLLTSDDQYFEIDNLAALSDSGQPFGGSSTFDHSIDDTDLLKCIN